MLVTLRVLPQPKQSYGFLDKINFLLKDGKSYEKVFLGM